MAHSSAAGSAHRPLPVPASLASVGMASLIHACPQLLSCSDRVDQLHQRLYGPQSLEYLLLDFS